MILKSAISADSRLLAKDALGHLSFTLFYEIMGSLTKISLVSYIVWQERYATDITDPQSGEFMTIKNKMLLGALLLVYQCRTGRTSHRGFDQYLGNF